ncbi:MAG: hypothetical protein ACXVPQ_09735 [Bacteroidia bacterium]
MRLCAAVIFTLIFCSCEQVGKLDARLYDSTEANVPITKLDQLTEIDRQENLPEKEGASKLIFKAIGTEPGWFGEFYNNRLRLVLDYGKDSLLVFDDSFENVSDEKGFDYKKEIELNGKKAALHIKIENEKCIEPGGQTVSKKAIVIYNNKVYKGCGLVVN